jgi:uncharacterized protein YecE (DUF72 family)
MPETEIPTKILVGCQAWTKGDWTTLPGGPTVFFPYGTKDKERLVFFAKIFDTVEINTSFYGVPKIKAFEDWYRQTPGDFIFSLKMPRDVTHAHSLQESAFSIAEQLLSRVITLKEKLGAILIQLPASFEKTRAALSDLRKFLDILPREIRFAVEFRSPEWFNPEIFDLLAERNIALCLGSSEFISREKMLEAAAAPSANFAYMRFGGPRDLTKFNHIQRPQDETMNFWAGHVKDLQAQGKQAFIYFSNHFEGHSPGSAMNFRKLLGQKFITPAELEPAPGLF